MYLQINNTALSDAVEIWDALVGDLNDRVDVFDEYREVLKNAIRKLQREMRDEVPGHAKVAEDLKGGRSIKGGGREQVRDRGIEIPSGGGRDYILPSYVPYQCVEVRAQGQRGG